MRNQSPHWVEPESSKVTGDHQQLHFSSVTMHAIKGFTLCSYLSLKYGGLCTDSLTPMLYDKAPSRPPVRPNVLSVVCNYYMYRVTPSVAQSTDENHGLLVYYTLHWAFLDVKAVRDNHLSTCTSLLRRQTMIVLNVITACEREPWSRNFTVASLE
ncbi:uncharacterized protein CIMG_11389 [Coccidioides immitis RS]|uniref:Uncharacterized protein n=1 Tax=Coccidioides immitis (strain RS) TaxID=246410 RepID=A0A0D8JUK6_COCIM|nr:uncharacterized protein CIMG_11389 [Coccidioides immitis RS]KJF61035.1 hypothetical protein CIMG_11389 [Coccidioides immitis RS]